MCTVQVLVVANDMRHSSDIRRGMVARPGNRWVCRQLFEPSEEAADPAAVMQRLQEEVNQQATRRWNFDFQREKPLPGRYQWEPVGSIRTPTAGSSKTQDTPDHRVVTELPNTDQHPKQSKITDFMNHRKKRSSGTVPCSKQKMARLNSCNTGNSSRNTDTEVDFPSISPSST